ncbi:MAG: hypothetical protein K0S18_676 [Anaerocolumna sp.]|jgi:flagellar protein FliO/FliZ|nr:hypothetical protein [Anaerocolumna sp.]
MSILAGNLSSLESFLQLLGVSILFVFVLLATYLTTKFVGGVKLNQYKNSNFKVIETYKITQNKFLQLIQIGNRFFAISVSKDDIQLIAEINEGDIDLTNAGKMQVTNFSDILSQITKKQKEKEHK